MPTRGSSKAPKFEGNPADLLRFFEDVEFLCEDAELDAGADRIKWAVRYTSRDEAELWEVMPSRAGDDWEAFKDDVLTFYPGAKDDDRKYSRADLDRLAAVQAEVPMVSRVTLGEYIRKFTVIASFLEKKKRISKGECDIKFLEGFHPTFKAQLLNRLTLAYLDHFPDDPWPSDRVIHHAAFLLAGTAMATPGRVTASPEPRSVSMPAPTVVKKEYYSTGSSYAPAAAATQTLGSGGSAQMQASYLPAARGPSPFREDPFCYFCGGTDGHRMGSCTLCSEYAQAGKCQRIGGRVYLADGSEIPQGLMGRTLRERIDNWLTIRQSMAASLTAERPAPQPPVQVQRFDRDPPPHMANTMFFGLEPESEWQLDIHPSSYMVDEEASEDMDEEDRIALARAYAQVEEVRTAIRKKKQVRFDGVEIPARRPVAGPSKGSSTAAPEASTQATQEAIPARPEPAASSSATGRKPTSTSASVPINASSTGTPTSKPSSPPQPQFQYQSPMEDPAVAQKLLERLLDVQVTVSACELLSVSVDMRKMVRELVATKRVAVASLETSPTPTSDLWLEYKEFIVRDDEGCVVARTSLPLRALDGTLNDRLRVECLLDQGAQIVAIRRDLWEALGVPIRPDLATTLEAANKSKEDTLGVVENARLKIGGMEFRLQIHVVCDAPFDILLGQPFFSLASCVTRDQMSGDQSVALTDPNTGIQLMMPTRQCSRPAQEPRFIRNEDTEEHRHRHCGAYAGAVCPFRVYLVS